MKIVLSAFASRQFKERTMERTEVIEQGKGSVGGKPPPPLAVTLPELPSVPSAWRGAKYVVRTLLGGEDNPKLRKSNRAGTPFKTWGLALAPAMESGFQTCASSSAACRSHCLYRQGHARIDPSIAACRVAKTIAWKKHREWFEARLRYELARIEKRAREKRFCAAIRLNLTSDIMWEAELPELFEQFADFQFYDYTKHTRRLTRFVKGELPANYHLTFSRSDKNDLQARDVLMAGANVAVVFRSRPFPARYLGFAVIDGDTTDLRFLDPAGVVVGLSARGTAKGDESGFVVDADGEKWSLRMAQ